MTAKEFLSQARYLDMRINSKVEQIDSLNDLATKCTSTLTGMPHNPSPSTSLMADAVCKIVDLQEELGRDVQELVELGVSKSLRLNNRATGVGCRVKKPEIKRGINPRR